jgi:hypothetical protein
MILNLLAPVYCHRGVMLYRGCSIASFEPRSHQDRRMNSDDCRVMLELLECLGNRDVCREKVMLPQLASRVSWCLVLS